MPIDKWSHISMLGGDPWILPIWNAINGAVTSGRVIKLNEELYKTGMDISIRLDMLPIIASRINHGASQLYGLYDGIDEKFVFTLSKKAFAYDVDDGLIYALLIDINSLLFEMNACWQFIKDLVEKLYAHIEKPLENGRISDEVRSILQGQTDPEWFPFLDGNRNYFIHEGSSYIAVDLTRAPSSYDLLIMKENLDSFLDGKKFIRLSQINAAVKGFLEARGLVQRHLMHCINSFGVM